MRRILLRQLIEVAVPAVNLTGSFLLNVFTVTQMAGL